MIRHTFLASLLSLGSLGSLADASHRWHLWHSRPATVPTLSCRYPLLSHGGLFPPRAVPPTRCLLPAPYFAMPCHGFHGSGHAVVLPPLYLNYAPLYPNRAATRFFGADRAAAADRHAAAVPRQLPPHTRTRPAGDVALGRRFIEFGDRQFRKGEYHHALQRYKKSAVAAPGLADAYFRQALAHAALGKYDRARRTVERGLELQPDWPDKRFRLDEVYDDPGEKLRNGQAVIDWLTEHPLDADAHFMLGVLLHFDGQPQRAQVAFARALELTGIGDHVRAFLPPADENVPQPPP